MENKITTTTDKEKQSPLVSVIIPVYNTAAYVEATIKSIINQTLKEIEIIIINDGSTDDSPMILERLASEEKRIKLINQSNKGQSAGRNVGIANASAPFLYFMDSDDLLLPDTLERCYNRCIEMNLDFITFDAEPFADNPKDIIKTYDRSKCLVEGEIYSGTYAIEKQLIEQCFTPSPCLYLVKKEFLNSSGMSFYEGIIHEDELFTSLLYLNAARIGYIPEKFFRRRYRSNSTMTSRFSWKNVNGYLTVTAQLEKSREKMDEKRNAIIDRFLIKMLNAVLWKAHVLPLCQRIRLLRIVITKRYTRYVSFNSIAVLMFKKYKR